MQERIRRATKGVVGPDEYLKIAVRLDITKRTLDRFMGEPPEKLIDLDRADRMLLAAGGGLAMDCGDSVVE